MLGLPDPDRASDRRRASTRELPARTMTAHDVPSAAPTVDPSGGRVVGERARQARRGRGHRVVWTLACLGALIGLVAGCDGHGPARPGLAGRVDRMARELADERAHNVIVLVSDRGRVYAATHDARATQRFRVGSVTKTFTAVIVLELAADGRLRLSDTLERYLPGVVPAGDRITIRELLDHRSGLANYVIYPAWQQRLKRSSPLHPIDALRFAAAQPLDFAPGTQWEYSNTNYIALGLIIEAVTHHSYAEQLRQRILTPLRLRDTELATARNPAGLDDRGVDPNGAWAAGAVVSSAQDIARFFTALLSGHILSGASLTKMKRTVDGLDGRYPVDDGLGIFLTRTPCGRFWGHSGEILNYGTLVDASDDGSRVAVISVRDAPPQRPDISQLLCRRPDPAG